MFRKGCDFLKKIFDCLVIINFVAWQINLLMISKALAQELVVEKVAVEGQTIPSPLPINPDPNSATKVIVERSGINVVNINQADSNKTSHNLYSDFNINPQGLILNNSANTSDGIVNTDLGGWIKDNPNLTNSGSANLIINEVNGNDISRLLGFLEVAGPKADVIIANPNGLLINNSGFINIGNISLINGKLQSDDSQLIFNIENSDKATLETSQPYWQKITVEGQGADFSRNQIAQLIGQYLKIDAPINGSDSNPVNLLTGNYRYNLTNSTLSSQVCVNQSECQNSQINSLAVDASNLAKIQAGKIYIVATQQGLGVKWLGEMIASQNGIEIDASGNITYQSVLAKNGNISVISNNGKIIGDGILQTSQKSGELNENFSNHNITLKAYNDIELSSLSRLLSASKIKIESDKKIFLNGSESSISSNDFELKAQDVENNSKLSTLNNFTLKATNLNNSSQILAKNIIDLTLTNKIINSGLIQGQEQVLIKALNLQNNNDDNSNLGKIYGDKIVKIDLELTDQQIADLPLDQTFTQNLSGSIEAKDNLEIKGYNIQNQASIIADKDLTIIAKNNFTNHATLSSKNNISITTTTGNLINDSFGQIIADNLINFLVENNFTNNNKISAKQNLNITTNLGDLTTGSGSQIISGNDLSLNSQNNLINEGVISAQNNVDLSVALADFTNKSSAKIIAGNDLQIIAKNDLNNLGILSAKNNITLTAIDNNFTTQNTSQIIADNDITITANNNINNSGVISAKKNITLESLNSNIENNNSSEIIAGVKDLVDQTSLIKLLATQGNITQNSSKGIFGNKNIEIETIDFINNSKLSTLNNFTLKATNLNNSSQILAKNIIDLTLTNKIINSGLIQGQEQVLIKALNLQNNNDDNSNLGKIYGDKIVKIDLELTDQQIADLPLDQTFTQNLSGSIEAKDNLEIKGYNLQNQASIIADKDLTIIAKNNIANSGIISANKNLTLESTAGNIINNNSGEIVGGIKDLVEQTSLVQLLATQGDILQNSSKAIVANRDLLIVANNFTNNFRVDVANNLTAKIANDLINSSNSTLIANGNVELNVVRNLINNSRAKIFAKNNLNIQKYSVDNPLQLINNKVELIQNNSGELSSFGGEMTINANKLQNQRVIKPAIALVEGEGYKVGDLLTNHELYSWVEDATLCNESLCATGVSKFRSTIKINSASVIASIRSNTNLTLNVDEIINEASSIAVKDNLTINAQILNNKNLNYNAKIYQKTVDGNGVIIDNQYFDDLDNDRSFTALLRYGKDLQKNVSQDLSNSLIEKANSNFLTENAVLVVNKNSGIEAINFLNSDGNLKNTLAHFDNLGAIANNIKNIELPTQAGEAISLSLNALTYSKESRGEFTDKAVLINILRPVIVDNSPKENSNNQEQPTQSLVKNEIENLVVNDLQKQFEQQAKIQNQDQFVKPSFNTEENIEKNNLFLNAIKGFNEVDLSQVQEVVEQKNQPVVNYKIIEGAQPKILEQTKLPTNSNIASLPISDKANIVKPFRESEIATTQDKSQTNSVIEDKITSNLAVSSQNSGFGKITENVKKEVMATSPSSLGKAIAQTVTPVIATGSKISKIIIEKSLGSKNYKASSSNIKFQSSVEKNDEDSLKQILLKTKKDAKILSSENKLINGSI